MSGIAKNKVIAATVLATILIALVVTFIVPTDADHHSALVMTVGYALAEKSVYDTAAKVFAEEFEKRTNGEVTVRTFSSFKMGGEQEMFKKLQLGTLDGTIIAQNNAGPFYEPLDLLVLPYSLQSYEHAEKVLDGPIGQKIWEDMPEKAGVHLVSIVQIAFRHIYNTKQPIENIDDFRQLKYRVPKNAVMVDTYKAFGSDPVPLAWSETLTAVQTGAVDGGDLAIPVLYAQKFHDVAKHLALTGHFAALPPFFVSDKFIKRLSDDQRAALHAAAAVAAEAGRRQSNDEEAEMLRKLTEDHGVGITRPDRAPFIAAAKQVHQAFTDRAEEQGARYIELLELIEDAAQ